MSNSRYRDELGSRIYDFLGDHYPNIEDIPPSEVFIVLELWSEFILDEASKVQIEARIDELEWLQSIYNKHEKDVWFRDPIPRRIEKLKKMRAKNN